MKHSRKNPSERFKRYIRMYEHMHKTGHSRSDGDLKSLETFKGEEILKMRDLLKEGVKNSKSKTMLDYGSGKGYYYFNPMPDCNKTICEYVGIDEFELFEPAIEEYSKLPDKKFDIVCCNDVIEHIPSPDFFWVLDEIFSLANKCVVIRISCTLAKSILPDGTNAHCTINRGQYWKGVIDLLGTKYNVSTILQTVENNFDATFEYKTHINVR